MSDLFGFGPLDVCCLCRVDTFFSYILGEWINSSLAAKGKYLFNLVFDSMINKNMMGSRDKAEGKGSVSCWLTYTNICYYNIKKINI